MTARFPKTYCSQCGGEFGPGNEGFGHCSDHTASNEGAEMANETRHTPGPWAVEPAEDFGAPQRDGSRAILSLYINAPKVGHGRIGQCFSNCLVSTDEELRLNAALFAAAPELLAACKEQHKAIDYLMARLIALDPEFLPTLSLHWNAIVQGHAAIARATGGTQ